MPVRSIARGTEQLVTAPPSATAAELASMMADGDVGSVIIVEESKPVGIVTDRDIAMTIVGHQRESDLPAKEFMTHDPATAEADAGVMELCQLMKEHGVRRIPVTEDGTLTGIVTLDDVVVLLEDEMKDISEVIRTESPPY